MSILSRITKIESALSNQPTGAILLNEPAADDNDEARAAFLSVVSEAIDSGSKVIVVRNGQDRLRRPGVTYVNNDFDGQLALAAATPDAIHGDRLRAILAQCRNTALPVVKEIEDGEI